MGRLPFVRGRPAATQLVNLRPCRSRRDRTSARASSIEAQAADEAAGSPQAAPPILAAPTAPTTPTVPTVPTHQADQPPAEVDDRKALVEELLDTSALGSRGEGWVAAQVAACVVVAVPPAPLTAVIDSVATLGVLLGGALVVYSCLNLGTNLSPLPEPRKKHQLVVSGLYKYARHPMYGGVLLLALGVAVLTHSETRLAATGVLWWVFENKVAMEEKALTARYPEYPEYGSKVKKFFPFIY